MKYLYFYLIVLLAFIFSCNKKSDPILAQKFVNGWNENLSLNIGNQPRYFRVYQPIGIAASAPVVILRHGVGQSMNDLFEPTAGGTRVWTTVADNEKFLLVVPTDLTLLLITQAAITKIWNDCRPLTNANPGYSVQDDVTFISKLIEWTKKSFNVDNTRFYATGVSNGTVMLSLSGRT